MLSLIGCFPTVKSESGQLQEIVVGERYNYGRGKVVFTTLGLLYTFQ